MDKRNNGRMKLTAEERVMTTMIRLAMKTSMILLMMMMAKMTMMTMAIITNMTMMMYLQESSGLTLAQQQLLAAAGD